MTTSISGVRSATVTARQLAAANLSPVEAAFAAVDFANGARQVIDLPFSHFVRLAGASAAYAFAAKRVAKDPVLRARVDCGEISLMDAAKSLRPCKQPQPAPTLFELFMGASAAERAECMAAVADEAFALLDDTTAPIGPAMPDLFVHSHHHL